MPEPGRLNVHHFAVATVEEGYKASRFNIRTEDKNGNLLLLNTYSNRFVRIEAEEKEVFKEVLRNPDHALPNHPAIHELVNRGFLVPKSVDEFRRAEFLHQETIANEGHLELTLLANEDCNFRCTYCYESFAKNFMQEWVQQAVIRYLEKNLHKYESLHVSWFGGEPLTAVPIIEKLSNRMIELCKQHKIRYTSSMTTNGYNLTLNNFKKLLKLRCTHYQITLDGIEDTHNQTRKRLDGKSTFERIVRNLRNIRDNIPNRLFNILVRGNINAEVLKVIDQYSDFLSAEFANDSRFQFHWQPVGNWGGDEISADKLCTYGDLFTPMYDAIEKGVDFSFYQKHFEAKDSVCYASKRNNFIIGSDGIIYKCTIAFDDEINHVGMISEQGTMHLDPDRYALWVTGHESSDAKCQKCFFRPSCQGASCPLMRIKMGEAPCPTNKVHFKDYMQLVSASSRNKIEPLSVKEVNIPV